MVTIVLSEQEVQVCMGLFGVASKHPDMPMQVTQGAVQMWERFAGSLQQPAAVPTPDLPAAVVPDPPAAEPAPPPAAATPLVANVRRRRRRK